jgi:hypothetical protein
MYSMQLPLLRVLFHSRKPIWSLITSERSVEKRKATFQKGLRILILNDAGIIPIRLIVFQEMANFLVYSFMLSGT